MSARRDHVGGPTSPYGVTGYWYGRSPRDRRPHRALRNRWFQKALLTRSGKQLGRPHFCREGRLVLPFYPSRRTPGWPRGRAHGHTASRNTGTAGPRRYPRAAGNNRLGEPDFHPLLGPARYHGHGEPENRLGCGKPEDRGYDLRRGLPSPTWGLPLGRSQQGLYRRLRPRSAHVGARAWSVAWPLRTWAAANPKTAGCRGLRGRQTQGPRAGR